MKRTFWGGLALLSAVFLPQLATAEPNLDRMSAEELLPLAQKEGKVTVYSFTSRIARVEKEFEKTYPGVDLIPSDMGSTEQIARLKTEAAAGISNADVIYLSDTPVVLTELLENGLIRNYVPPRIENRMPAEFKAPLLSPRLSTKVLMYSEEAYPDGSPIRNLWQMTTDEWRGRVVIVDPLQKGDYLDLMTEFVLRADEMAKAYEAQFGKPVELDEGVDNAGTQFIIDPDNPALKANVDASLERMFAHELHHAARWDGPGYGTSLGEALVSEGLAGHFVLELFGGSPEPWEQLPESEIRTHAALAAKEWERADYNHEAWFFGRGDLPRWLGYSLGFRLVERFLSEPSGSRASKLTVVQAQELRPMLNLVSR